MKREYKDLLKKTFTPKDLFIKNTNEIKLSGKGSFGEVYLKKIKGKNGPLLCAIKIYQKKD